MKIATFNINGIRARLPRLVEWLEREQPDVACLQELKCADEALPVADIEAAGYGAVWHGQKGFNGVAILAKGATPDLRRVGLPGDPDDSHSRYIEAEVGGVTVASIYLPNGNPIGTEKFEYKLRWMERLREHAATLLASEQAVVLAGDYNVVAEDRDVWSAERMAHDALLQPDTRAAWRKLLFQGWTDALRALHPRDDKLWTFWDYTAGCWQRDAGFRIDHLLLSPAATDRLLAAGVDRWVRGEEKASDHAPTWVVLD
ncbi:MULTISPECIES: exodeoxyribonuclease III [Sphingomonas]|uniref:exodeoxyribonuclease III n=1 Tax=Sphingomonas TaxID=13687 RepID=UPI000DEF5EBF|nr:MULTISPECIES: exodeoxyribonuclease III [Sphingomonas]